MHAEVDNAHAILEATIPREHTAMMKVIASELLPRFTAIDARMAGIEARLCASPATTPTPAVGLTAAPAVTATPAPPALPAFPGLPGVYAGDLDADTVMPPITSSWGAWSDADGWLRAAATGSMDAVAVAFIAAVQPSLHPGQVVALRAMVRAAMEAAAEAGRFGMTAGTFVPILRPLVVAALSYAVAMARTNAGGTHPAFSATAVDELMSLPQWTTRTADARMKDLSDRLRVFPAGVARRPASAPKTPAKGRGGRGAAKE